MNVRFCCCCRFSIIAKVIVLKFQYISILLAGVFHIAELTGVSDETKLQFYQKIAKRLLQRIVK